MSVRYLLAPSLVDFRAEVNRLDPGRDKASDGWIGNLEHSARVSRHNPDDTRPVPLVRAVDIDKDGDEWDDLGDFIAEHLRRRRDPRTNVVIWRGRIFSSYANRTRRAWEWGPYSGPNAHRAHVHHDVISGPAGARAGSWGLDFPAPPTAPPPTPEETDMAQLDDDDIARIRTEAVFGKKIGGQTFEVHVQDLTKKTADTSSMLVRVLAALADPAPIRAAVAAGVAQGIAQAATAGGATATVDVDGLARAIVREIVAGPETQA